MRRQTLEIMITECVNNNAPFQKRKGIYDYCSLSGNKGGISCEYKSRNYITLVFCGCETIKRNVCKYIKK